MPDEKKPDAPAAEEPKPETIKHDLPKKEIVAPDGHVILSEEDIKNRA